MTHFLDGCYHLNAKPQKDFCSVCENTSVATVGSVDLSHYLL